ncbi:MAG TPA: hypothetical protein VHA05_00250 [Candidatus Saccharimonadales bacterium]|nr:hypothetical protein [Candidatus Saccharimonadales bacterium]
MYKIFSILGLGLGIGLLIAMVIVLVFIFEVWMFISAITNKNISDTARVLWAVGMVLIHPIVAIVYYFTDHRKA